MSQPSPHDSTLGYVPVSQGTQRNYCKPVRVDNQYSYYSSHFVMFLIHVVLTVLSF